MPANTRSISRFEQVTTILELIYHHAVRDVRKSHGNAIIGLLLNIAQTMILVAVFMLIFVAMGMRGAAIRGDTLIYLISGVFLFMVHVKVIGKVVGTDGPASNMMQHRPMNPIIAIGGAALGELYIQLLSVLVILFLYHAIWAPIEIHQPVAAFGMLLAVWFAGVAVGVVLYAIRPWMPGLSQLLTMAITRLNMVASGKFFLANALPEAYLKYFAWNPLFHAIDQARGFAFINYNPMHTSMLYPVYVGVGLLLLGMLGEFYTRHRASLSWSARH